MNNIKKEWWVITITYLQVRRWDLRPYMYSSIPEVHKHHIIHPEDVDNRLHVPPKTFYPHNPPTFTAPHSEYRNFDIRRSVKHTYHVGLPNYAQAYGLSKRCRYDFPSSEILCSITGCIFNVSRSYIVFIFKFHMSIWTTLGNNTQ